MKFDETITKTVQKGKITNILHINGKHFQKHSQQTVGKESMKARKQKKNTEKNLKILT